MDSQSRRRPVVIGTAGHVDHGKTALVKALTGVDTDRLPEEKAREISIELGFAPLVLPDGTTASIVDVPGHERFIKNMLAGATGVDVALLVIDAREGVREQTREHLDILGLLGVTTGVAALTKIDTVSPEAASATAAALEAYLRRTSLAGCPVVPVSARTGEGLAELLEALGAAVAWAVPRADRPGTAGGPARLAIDRAFVAPGFGLVVTGTVASGTIAEGQRLQVYPAGPVVRVRRLEVHGAPVPAVRAGERAALNLASLGQDLRAASLRGLVLAEPGSLEPSNLVGLSLRLLAGSRALRDLERIRLHTGTSETLGRIILLHRDKELRPVGRAADVVFEAEQPLALAPGQAFVIRTYSPPRTVGGGTVLVPDAGSLAGPRPRSREAREHCAAALASAAGPVLRPPVPGGFAPLTSYLRLIGPSPDVPGPPSGAPGQSPASFAEDGPPSGARGLPSGVRLLAGGQHVAEETFYQRIRNEAAARLRAQHETKPHLALVAREALWSWLNGQKLPPAVWLESLAADGLLVLEGGRVRLAGRTPVRSPALNEAAGLMAGVLLDGGFTPPTLAELSERLGRELAVQALEILMEEGVAVCPTGPAGALAGDPVFHSSSVAAARKLLEEHLARHGEITVAAFRDLIGSTRKFALPLLEHFDREKVTRRRGDLRVRHPSRPREGTG